MGTTIWILPLLKAFMIIEAEIVTILSQKGQLSIQELRCGKSTLFAVGPSCTDQNYRHICNKAKSTSVYMYVHV